MASINVKGNILKELRESLNIPIEVIARKMSVDVDIVKAWEENGCTLTIPKLKKLAAIYKRHWAVFLLDSLPKKSDLPRDHRSIRNRTTELSTATLSAFFEAERILLNSEEINGREIDNDFIELQKRSEGFSAEDLAEKVRSLFNAPYESIRELKGSYKAYTYWVDILESFGFLVAQMDLELKEVRAFSLSKGKRSIIVVSRKDTYNGRIFSLFHELGHLLLNKTALCDLHEVRKVENNIDAVEVFCNQFAGSLLVPSSYLDKFNHINNIHTFDDVIISTLARLYKVSKSVILRRLLTLKLIETSYYDLKQLEYEKEIEELNKANAVKRNAKEFRLPKDYHQKKVIQRNSKGFVQDLVRAYYDNKLSFRDISKYMNTKINYLPKIVNLIST